MSTAEDHSSGASGIEEQEQARWLSAADGRGYAEKFCGVYSHRILDGIGHDVPHEAPGAFTDAILELGGGLR